MAETLKKDDEYSKLEIDTSVIEDEVFNEKPVELKEYQKLLIQDENRLKASKAKRMLKMGLFDQYTKTVDEFSLEAFRRLDFIKDFKGHELYEDINGTLYYIAAKNESDEESPDVKTYSYDIIEIDNVDDETFKKLTSAHSHEMTWPVTLGLVLSGILLVYSFISLIYSVVFLMVDAGYDFFTTFFYYNGSNFLLFGVAISLFTILYILKRKFDSER